mmetsp:Transcript_62816/g.185503  ORF Transcript_62816/g.185503 Transcript_62816/m.185503 type:complete len:175 (+) Transcript_62816:135-659(+)
MNRQDDVLNASAVPPVRDPLWVAVNLVNPILERENSKTSAGGRWMQSGRDKYGGSFVDGSLNPLPVVKGIWEQKCAEQSARRFHLRKTRQNTTEPATCSSSSVCSGDDSFWNGSGEDFSPNEFSWRFGRRGHQRRSFLPRLITRHWRRLFGFPRYWRPSSCHIVCIIESDRISI